MNHLQQLFHDARPKTSLAFVTHRAQTGGIMTVCLEKEQKEAIVHWKKLNIIIRRGTLFLCQYEKVVENGEHKLLVTKAIEINKTQPIYKIENIYTTLRLFAFTMHTDNSVNATCVETGYEARLIVDTDCSAFKSGDILVGWARFEDRNNMMGASWYLIEVENTLEGWNKKQKTDPHKLTLSNIAGPAY